MSDRREDQTATRASLLLIPLLAGAVVAVAIGVIGRAHPARHVPWLGPFPSFASMKVWLTVAVLVLAAVQLFTALWMYGKLGLPSPSWLGKLHKASGGAAFVVSLPVAAACLWGLGLRHTDTRVLVHGLFGCAFYGAFVAKVLVLHSKRLPGWALPVVAGVLFTALVGAGLTSAVWYLNTIGMPK
jgi:Family of unknown function (DUF6529)